MSTLNIFMFSDFTYLKKIMMMCLLAITIADAVIATGGRNSSGEDSSDDDDDDQARDGMPGEDQAGQLAIHDVRIITFDCKK